MVLNHFATPPPLPLSCVVVLFSPVSAICVLVSLPVCAYPAVDVCLYVPRLFSLAINFVVIHSADGDLRGR